MSRAQRIVLIIYCLLVVYCSVWIPLHEFQVVNPDGTIVATSIGYGWLWSAESEPPAIALVMLRLLAVTAIAGAAFLLAGKWRSP